MKKSPVQKNAVILLKSIGALLLVAGFLWF
jgi:hypothetical protein